MLVYDVAMTLDGFIAHEDGTTGGFLDGEHGSDYLARLAGYDAVVMGRRTYEYGYAFGLVPGQRGPLYGHMRHLVFSRSLRFGPDAQVEVVGRDEAACVKGLKAEGGSDIYLWGGGAFAGFLLDQGLIDRVVIKLNPVVLGRGIRLFGGSDRKARLGLVSSKPYGNGVLLLCYDVTYPGAPAG
jgi:dihydrofolate reductase